MTVVLLACTSRDVHFRFCTVNDLPKRNEVTNIGLINLSMALCFVFPLILMFGIFPLPIKL